jgi:hypothetical protein
MKSAPWSVGAGPEIKSPARRTSGASQKEHSTRTKPKTTEPLCPATRTQLQAHQNLRNPKNRPYKPELNTTATNRTKRAKQTKQLTKKNKKKSQKDQSKAKKQPNRDFEKQNSKQLETTKDLAKKQRHEFVQNQEIRINHFFAKIPPRPHGAGRSVQETTTGPPAETNAKCVVRPIIGRRCFSAGTGPMEPST